MFKNYNNCDLAIIALLLEEEEEESSRKSKRRKIWVHKSLLNRKTEGEFFTLYRELLDDEAKFHQYFRMSRYQFNDLLSNIEDAIVKKSTTFREAITPIEKLAVCLRFLATGDSMLTIAFSYRLGHSTVWSIIKEVCNAIISKMMAKVMPAPSEEDWGRIANDFWTLWNFPNCIGALDGKHVEIEAPANSGSLFFNYKKTFSIVLLALVDAQYKFIAVDIGAYGKNSDGGIFGHSNLGKRLENGQMHIPPPKCLPGTQELMPHVIVADAAFPLKEYLLRPYPASQIKDDETKANFNTRLSRARRVVENAFGILTQRFHIYRRQLKSKPEYADKIVLTTCILHNFIGESNIMAIQPARPDNNHSLTDLPRQGGSAQIRAFDVREAYKLFFNSRPGALPWAT